MEAHGNLVKVRHLESATREFRHHGELKMAVYTIQTIGGAQVGLGNAKKCEVYISVKTTVG